MHSRVASSAARADEAFDHSPRARIRTVSTTDDPLTRPGDVPGEASSSQDEVSATIDDIEAADTPKPLPRWVDWTAVAVVSLIAMWFWQGFWMEGHNGGDDFALYLNQGRALIQGDVGETLANTRYTVDNSAWHTFSPYAYPWGLPVLLAGVMALTGAVDQATGIDYTPFKFLITVCFLIALWAYHAMLRRRVHPFGSVLLPWFFALNFIYVLHLDNVLSELPFMMALMLFVVGYDRVREAGGILGPRLWPLVGLGLLACFAFNVRREGLGLVVAMALGQLAEIVAQTAPGDGDERGWKARLERVRGVDGKAVAAPWTTFVGVSVVFQMMLPSDIAPRFVERDPTAAAGLHRIVDNLRIYEPFLAEQLGLKDLGPTETTAFGSAAAGAFAFWTVVVLMILGVMLSVILHPRRELPVAGAMLGVLLFVMIAPFQTYRYIMALLPFGLYYAYQGIAIPLGALPGKHFPRLVIVADLCVVAFIFGGWPDTSNARDYRTNFVGPQPGPQQPHTLEMYRAVHDFTRGDTVIVANRARLMTLYTGRTSVQGGAIDFIDSAGDYYVMYLEPDGSPGTYSQYPLTDDDAAQRGFVEVWRNPGWVLWRTPPIDRVGETP